MHGGYSVHGNCGGGKLKIFLPYVLFIIWLLITLTRHTNNVCDVGWNLILNSELSAILNYNQE
jgi:hypothetical protein